MTRFRFGRLRAFAWGLAVLPGVLSWTSAYGQSKPKSAPSPAGEVALEIAVVGTAADLLRIRTVVEPRQLRAANPRWVRVARFDPMEILEGDRDQRGASLRCWIDALDPKRTRLYFAARSGRQFLVRDLELSGNFDEIDRESLSQVIELSITALLEDERAGMTRAQTQALLANREKSRPRSLAAPPPASPPQQRASSPPSAPSAPSAPRLSTATPAPPAQPLPSVQPVTQALVVPSTPPAPPPPPVSVEVLEPAPPVIERKSPPERSPSLWGGGVFYGVHALGSGPSFAQGPGLSLSWGAVGDRPGIGAWISGQYQLPERELGSRVSIRFETIAARGGLEVRLPVALHHLSLRLGIGTDLVRVSPQPGTVDASAMLTPVRWSQSLVFTAAVGMRWAVGHHMLLGASLLADVLPTVVHYDLDVAGSTSEVYSPWRARPGVALEVSLR